MTWDAIGLFTNIPHQEGIDLVRKALQEFWQEPDNKEVPTEYIISILEIILENNIFELDSELYKQNVGAAMGCKPVP